MDARTARCCGSHRSGWSTAVVLSGQSPTTGASRWSTASGPGWRGSTLTGIAPLLRGSRPQWVSAAPTIAASTSLLGTVSLIEPAPSTTFAITSLTRSVRTHCCSRVLSPADLRHREGEHHDLVDERRLRTLRPGAWRSRHAQGDRRQLHRGAERDPVRTSSALPKAIRGRSSSTPTTQPSPGTGLLLLGSRPRRRRLPDALQRERLPTGRSRRRNHRRERAVPVMHSRICNHGNRFKAARLQ